MVESVKKGPLVTGGKRRQTTASNSKLDPFEGVVKPDELREQIRGCVAGNDKSRSYCRGALQFLQRRSPNPYIVPLLKKVLEQ